MANGLEPTAGAAAAVKLTYDAPVVAVFRNTPTVFAP